LVIGGMRVDSACIARYFQYRPSPIHRFVRVSPRRTRVREHAHEHVVELARCHTVQFDRSFVAAVSRTGNCLPGSVFEGRNLNVFEGDTHRRLSD